MREAPARASQETPAGARTAAENPDLRSGEREGRARAIGPPAGDPRSPWQRGTKENTKSLLHQYLSKGTDLSGDTQRELNAIA